MDLKIKDVAELLRVSEKTIRRWLQDGKIPAYRLNHQYRFSRLEIQDWVMAQKLHGRSTSASGEEGHTDVADHRHESNGHQAFSLLRAMMRGGIHQNLPGESKAEIIRNTMQRLAEPLDMDAELLTTLLLDREALMPTALNHGVAVPHTRDFLMSGAEDAIAVVFPEHPVEYGALDHQPVSCLFFLFAHSDKQHLHLLAKIAHLCTYPLFQQKISRSVSPKDFLEMVRLWESEQLALSQHEAVGIC